jgi:ubiquinone/menaquinone biosynthesis C-methylase UbiE
MSVEVGFTRVDAQPDAASMVASMEATARWPAVRQLRRWERERLALRPGDRLLDVGCGIGDVALSLAADVTPGGEVVAIDASEVMLDTARQRAAQAGGPAVRFRTGDAHHHDEPDGSFAGVRCERVLQWLPDPAAAIAEMVRVLSPRGRLSLIDTDWRTFAVDVPATAEAAAVTAAMLRMRGDGALAGGRLLNLCRDAGLVELDCTGAVHIWTEWDPDRAPGPAGLFPLRETLAQLAALGLLDAEVTDRFVDTMVEAGRAGRFCATLSLVAVSGRKP